MLSEDDPLINPCKCKGTQGLIHVSCLKKWMTTEKKEKMHSDSTIEYQWKIIQCEICKQIYPHTISFKNQSVSILDYSLPSHDYMVIESFPKEGSKSAASKSVFVVNIERKKEVIFGRG